MSFLPLPSVADASAPLALGPMGPRGPAQRLTLERCLLLALAAHVLGFALLGLQRIDRARPAPQAQEAPLTLRLEVAPIAEIEPAPVARPAPLPLPVPAREPARAPAPTRERAPVRAEHEPLVAVPPVVPDDPRVPLQTPVTLPVSPADTGRVDLTGAPVGLAKPLAPGSANGTTASLSGPGTGLDLRVKIDTRTLAQTARETLPAPSTGPQKLAQGVDGAARPDCLTAYSEYGLLSVIPLVRDAITGKGCK